MYTPDGIATSCCPDTGTSINLIDRALLSSHWPNLAVQTAATPVNLSGIGRGPVATEFVSLPFAFQATDYTLIPFVAEAYIVDGLPVGLLLSGGFLKTNSLDFIWRKGPETIDHMRWQGLQIPISVTKETQHKLALPDNQKRAQIYVAESITIPAGMGRNVPITHHRLPYLADGYLIDAVPQKDFSLDSFGTLVSGIVQGTQAPIPYSNFGDRDIHLVKGQVIGVLKPAPRIPHTSSVYLSYDSIFEGLPPLHEDPEGKYPDGYPHLIQPIEPVTIDWSQADVSDHFGEDHRQKILSILKQHAALFRSGLGRFNDGVDMPIPFKEGVDIKDLKQAPYNLSARDRVNMDKILDPLTKLGVVEPVPLGSPCPAASPAFMVYRKDDPKGRMVIDLRRVNTKVHIDAYPLPRQDDILTSMSGATIFSIVDMTKSFFQQPLAVGDRWKTAFVTPHRGHEQMTVSTMGLASSPSFFQHRMERIFGKYLWKFVAVYIDDTIIFSTSPEQHIHDLSTVLTLLMDSGVTLSLAKCHFAQPGLKALGHWVDRLGLSTVDEKVEAIKCMKFPDTLSELENGLGFFGYYRKFVRNFAAISRPLQELKAKMLKASPTGKSSRKSFTKRSRLDDQMWITKQMKADAHNAWDSIKLILCDAPTLAFPNFLKPFILYVDGSKERGFGAALHQMGEDGVERPILYISKDLSPAEKNYWPTELETGALVWALQKLPQYLDHSNMVVFTDHSAIKDAMSLASVHGKRSLRLTNWRLFLSKYLGRIEIKHRPGTSHLNADGLSRIAREPQSDPVKPSFTKQISFEKASVFTTYTNALPVQTRRAAAETPHEAPDAPDATEGSDRGDALIPVPDADAEINEEANDANRDNQYMSSLHVHPDVLKSIARNLPHDPTFSKIYTKLVTLHKDTKHDEAGPVTEFQFFRRDPRSKLLFYIGDNKDRLCVPSEDFKKVLRMAHDDRAHVGANRVYYFLREHVFFPNMKRRITEYTTLQCPVCIRAKPKRSRPWGSLHPIDHPVEPLSVLCIDFVDGLPTSSKGNDKVMFITCKSSKFIAYLVGKTTDSAEDWADKYYNVIYSFWGFPDKLISDQDSKFMGRFWTALFRTAKVQLAFTAAHHSSANGQAERTNQTSVHALRCAIGGRYDQSNWEELLPGIQLALNSSVNTSTNATPYFLMYGRHPKFEFSQQDQSSEADDWIRARECARKEALEAVHIAQAKMKLHYDSTHIPPVFTDYAYLRISKKHEKGYHLQNHTKLSFDKIGPLKIIRKHSDLAYEIELPSWLTGINPIISVEFLEPAPNDPSGDSPPPPPSPGPITLDGQEKYIIESIIGKESRHIPGKRGRHPHYEIKWLGYDATSFEPCSIIEQDVPQLVRQYENSRRR